MGIDFDFMAPEVSGVANGMAPGGGVSAVLCTIPMATAAFPLQAGRSATVYADFVGVRSNGDILGSEIQHTVVPATSTYLSPQLIQSYSSSSPSGPGLHMNASGDCEVYWSNGNAGGSGLTEDVAVRVRVRWIGA
jgi:hypothetical protein